MPVFYTPIEDPQEPSQTVYPALPMQSVWDVSTIPTPVALADRPALLEAQDNLSILHRQPNFFVLVTPDPDDQPMSSHASNDATQERVFAHLNTRSAAMRLVVVEQPRPGDDEGSLDHHPPLDHVPNSQKYEPHSLKTINATLVAARIPTWLETIIVIIGLTVSFASHAINMFYYPHYEQDEGTYMMYAWAVTHGSIDPYPYGYGHPPFAWIQIAAWVKFTGGFFTFGNAIDSGRVLMLLFAVGCSLLVYQIARCLGANLSACLLAMVIFSLSPLSITFQREVLLDNVATFWFLLTVYLLVVRKSHLLYTVSAGISFGFALLSKEVLIVLLPVLIYIVWLYSARFQRTFALTAFTYVVVACGSAFVLMATLKGELFPYNWHLPWDHHQHLSLIDTYMTQAKRGQSDGSIIDSWNAWIKADPLLIVFGIAAPIFNLIAGWWNRRYLFLSLFAISFWLLLIRGGVVFAFYIIPLIPLIALNIVLALNSLVRWLGRLVRFELVGVLLIFGVLAAIIPYDVQHSLNPYNLFTQRPSLVQTQAVTWIRAHVPHRAMIVINSNIFTDLHEQGSAGVGDGTTYPYAHVYWFVALDPSLHDTLLKNNWDRIDYIVIDSEMLNDIQHYGGEMDLIKTALAHSVLRVEFKGDNHEFVQIYQVVHIISPPEV
ncbi:MAG: ArnT family glycosyltransferase [Ktedonobacteraceae bacterium]